MMFAGVGLFVAMTVTATMMSGDVARMAKQERAKKARECAAAMAEANTTGMTAAGDPGMSADPYGQPAPATTPADDTLANCPKPDAAATTPGAEGTPAMDPNTGQAVDPYATDPSSSQYDGTSDGATGQDPSSTTSDEYPSSSDQSTSDDSMSADQGGYDASDDEFAGRNGELAESTEATGGTTFVPEGDGLATSGF